MSQFASTLYPQTNPSNPVLLDLRARVEFQDSTNFPSTPQRIARTALATLDRRWTILHHAPSEQIEHARRVLTRLANLTG